jgi:hypothetical protein
MFNSNALEVGVGLIFTFLAVSLITGAIVETITSVVGWRANTLLNGIKALLNDSNFDALAHDLYDHASINPRGPGAAPAGTPSTGTPSTSAAATGSTVAGGVLSCLRHIFFTRGKPSYIDKDQFANALMDITGMSAAISGAAATTPTATATRTGLVSVLIAAVDTKIPALGNPQISQLLHGIIDLSLGDAGRIKQELAAWFDNGMDRLSGVYKRWTQLLSFLIALLLAFLLNVDSITIAKAVWEQPTLVENLKPPASSPAATTSSSGAAAVSPSTTSPISGTATSGALKNAEDALKKLDSYLPVGWPNGFFITKNHTHQTDIPLKDKDGNPRKDSAGDLLYCFTGWDFLLAFFGWLITAIATLFGAPFWFDALQQITRLKGSGPSPAEKTAKKAAAE